TQSNLVVQTKDRNGNTTTHAYDGHGRVTTSITAANDPAVAVSRVSTYMDGTTLPSSTTSAGETTTYEYDYRQRAVAVTVQPKVGTLLMTRSTFTNNLLTSSTDPYGRHVYNVYRPSDSALIRTIKGTVPVDGVADPATQGRDLNPNAK